MQFLCIPHYLKHHIKSSIVQGGWIRYHVCMYVCTYINYSVGECSEWLCTSVPVCGGYR